MCGSKWIKVASNPDRITSGFPMVSFRFHCASESRISRPLVEGIRINPDRKVDLDPIRARALEVWVFIRYPIHDEKGN